LNSIAISFTSPLPTATGFLLVLLYASLENIYDFDFIFNNIGVTVVFFKNVCCTLLPPIYPVLFVYRADNYNMEKRQAIAKIFQLFGLTRCGAHG